MMKFVKIVSSLAPYLAGAAFVVILAAFGLEMAAFRSAVGTWARRDLQTQAELAAENLDEPLRTQDLRRVAEIAQNLGERSLRLTVYSRPGGVFYRTSPDEDGAEMRASADAGEYRIELGYPEKAVYRPFHEALVGFALAALVGVAAMFVVFFALYRQRVRIRELARLEEFRRAFIADVSHEIKTPLTGILGAAEMLADGGAADDAARGRLLAMVTKESKRLNALVQQILDLARLEREGEALDRAETDLADLARETVETLRPRAEASGVRLVLAPSGGPCVANADARLVGEALSNLVENAIRHSGSPDVEVSASASGGVARLVVEDHGVGIPPEHAARVFERFHRVDPARAAESGGAGLGLAIVRRIARLHGGDVALAPAAPRGCRFTLSIPA